jgi:hypothetical protein
MLKTNTPQKEKFRGSFPSASPTVIEPGVFSLCSGGVPKRGAFARIPGKTLKALSTEWGGVIAINDFGQKIVVQYYTGVVVYDIQEIEPNPANLVVDNSDELVLDNSGNTIIV